MTIIVLCEGIKRRREFIPPKRGDYDSVDTYRAAMHAYCERHRLPPRPIREDYDGVLPYHEAKLA